MFVLHSVALYESFVLSIRFKVSFRKVALSEWLAAAASKRLTHYVAWNCRQLSSLWCTRPFRAALASSCSISPELHGGSTFSGPFLVPPAVSQTTCCHTENQHTGGRKLELQRTGIAIIFNDSSRTDVLEPIEHQKCLMHAT